MQYWRLIRYCQLVYGVFGLDNNFATALFHRCDFGRCMQQHRSHITYIIHVLCHNTYIHDTHTFKSIWRSFSSELGSACCHFSHPLVPQEVAFTASTVLVWHREEHLVCKKIEWWCAGIVICLQRGANDLHIIPMMPLPPHNLFLH